MSALPLIVQDQRTRKGTATCWRAIDKSMVSSDCCIQIKDHLIFCPGVSEESADVA